MCKCFLKLHLYTCTHAHTYIMALKCPLYLEAAKGKTCKGKRFEWTCKVSINVLFQEYNCLLILNVCQGVRVTDAVTYSKANKGFTWKNYRRFEECVFACICEWGRRVCFVWCLNGVEGGIQALTNQPKSWGPQEPQLFFYSIVTIAKF